MNTFKIIGFVLSFFAGFLACYGGVIGVIGAMIGIFAGFLVTTN